MRTKKFEKKLSINKRTISQLQTPEMEKAKGGYVITMIEYCTNYPCDTNVSCRFCLVPA